jgi:hypothetical protein
MDNRLLLQRVLNGGQARYSKERVCVVCNGEKTTISEREINTDIDINIEIHCNDRKQLELQNPKE